MLVLKESFWGTSVEKRQRLQPAGVVFLSGGSTATGVLIGSLLGGFFLRGYKKWPLYIGGGLGFGMAYTNCENSLNSFLLSMDPKACIIKKTP